MPRLAFSYRRFSTPEQSKGDSARRQDAAFTDLCKRHGLVPATTYFDEGKSGWKAGKQRDLARFQDLVKSGKVPEGSWLVIESLDRLSRQGFRKTQSLLSVIIEGGCTVATTNPERVLTVHSLDDPMALMEILFIATRAKEESDRKSERVRAAWHAKLAKAKTKGHIVTNRPPAWLRLSEDKTTWETIPERVKVVQTIFRLATVNGLGQRAICKRLNKMGIQPFGRGKGWGWAYIQQILNDGKVLGRFKNKLGVIEGYYPAIIDEKTFLKAKALTSQRKRFTGNTTTRLANLFAGLAYDLETGSTMVYVKKNASRPARWVPSVFEKGSSTDKGKSFPYDIFEDHFLKITTELTLADIGEYTPQSDERLNAIDTELVDIELRIGTLRQTITTGDIDRIAEYSQILNSLDAQRKALANERDMLNAEKQLMPSGDALAAGKTIIQQLTTARESDIVDLRSRLRQAIRSIIRRIDCRIHKRGWDTELFAHLHFHSGHTRLISLVVRRGVLTRAIYDQEKHKDGAKARVLVRFDKKGRPAGEALKATLNTDLQQRYGITKYVPHMGEHTDHKRPRTRWKR